jgi:integrase
VPPPATSDPARSETVDLVPIDRFNLRPELLNERAVYRLGRLAPATLTAYTADWADYSAWCRTQQIPARTTDPATVTGYLAYLASLLDDQGNPAVAHATLERRVAAIAFGHAIADLPSPTAEPIVRDALAFWAHQLGTNPRRQPAKAFTTRQLRQLVEHQPPTRAGDRNRALLLVGFAAALRRSELAALTTADIETVDEGLVITIRNSKTDQTGDGEHIGIPYGANPTTCPVRAHHTWLTTRGDHPGPWLVRIRRGDTLDTNTAGIAGAAVNDIVQAACRTAGLPDGYSAHSLRAGFITTAAAAGVPQWAIMAHARHRSILVNTRYIRRGTLFISNAAAQLGL